MEELTKLHDSGSSLISLPLDWEKIDDAKEFLISKYGYVEKEVWENLVLFEHDSPIVSSHSSLIFPEESPEPHLRAPEHRGIHDSGWEDCDSFQLDTASLPEAQKFKVNAQEKLQTVVLKFVVQPSIQKSGKQIYLKLGIDKLQLGVSRTDFLQPKEGLGFYPYFIQITLEPEYENAGSGSQPVYKMKQQDVERKAWESTVELTQTTTVSASFGFSPARFTVNHAWGKAVALQKTILVPVEGMGSESTVASFEWTMLRWHTNEPYDPANPAYALWRTGQPLLPFSMNGKATTPMLNVFPDAWWRFTEQEVMPTGIRVRVRSALHLVYAKCSGCFPFIKSYGWQEEQFQFTQLYPLNYPALSSSSSSASPPSP